MTLMQRFNQFEMLYVVLVYIFLYTMSHVSNLRFAVIIQLMQSLLFPTIRKLYISPNEDVFILDMCYSHGERLNVERTSYIEDLLDDAGYLSTFSYIHIHTRTPEEMKKWSDIVEKIDKKNQAQA